MHEERFRKGLNIYIEESCIKKTAFAKKIGIRTDTFGQIVNGKRKIFAEEIVLICNGLNVTLDELLKLGDSNGELLDNKKL